VVRSWFKPPEYDGPRVVEEPGHLRLDVADRPLLEHVAQGVPIGDRHSCRGALDLLDRLQLPVVEPGGSGLSDPGDRDRRRLVGPLADELLGQGDVSVGAHAHDPEAVVEERHTLVVVAVRSGQTDVDDECGASGCHLMLLGLYGALDCRLSLAGQTIALESNSGWAAMKSSSRVA
jgi:hypothetical protein